MKSQTTNRNNDDFYPGASEDFFGEKPDSTSISDSEMEHSSKIGCLAVVVIIIVGILVFVLLF